MHLHSRHGHPSLTLDTVIPRSAATVFPNQGFALRSGGPASYSVRRTADPLDRNTKPM